MINVRKLNEYFMHLLNSHSGIITKIFLANNQSQILASLDHRNSQSSSLSTLLNDSLYILKMNLFGEDYQDFISMEVITQMDTQTVFLYNLHDSFIFGLGVQKSKTTSGRQIAQQAMKFMHKQLKAVATVQQQEEN